MLWARYKVAVLLDGEIVASLNPSTIQARAGERENWRLKELLRAVLGKQ